MRVCLPYGHEVNHECQIYTRVIRNLAVLMDERGIPQTPPHTEKLGDDDVLLVPVTPELVRLPGASKRGGRQFHLHFLDAAAPTPQTLPPIAVLIERAYTPGCWAVVETEENRLRFINGVRAALNITPEPPRIIELYSDDEEEGG